MLITNILIFIVGVIIIYFLRKRKISFQLTVLTALMLGLVIGFGVKEFTTDTQTIKQTLSWYKIAGTGYLRLLKMLIIPLIFISIVYAITSMSSSSGFGKKTAQVIFFLLFTNAVAAGVGIFYTKSFGLTEVTLVQTEANDSDIQKKHKRQDELKNKPIQETIIEIIPDNIVYTFSGQGSNPTLSTVLLAFIVSFVALIMKKKKEKSFQTFFDIISSGHDLMMYIVKFVMALTPYGVLSLMAAFAFSSDFASLINLGTFIVASYAAIITMFIIHGFILFAFKTDPLIFFKKATEPLLFAFSSRSSAGTLPLTVSTLNKKMGVPEDISNLSGSLGTSIGQNGCAGIYPAMVAVMVAASSGIELDFIFILNLIIIITISSLGIAGVGGGATNASIVVLSTLGLPINLVGILASIEPIIDMARTSLNVSDSMVTGVAVSKLNNSLDQDIYNKEDIVEEEE